MGAQGLSGVCRGQHVARAFYRVDNGLMDRAIRLVFDDVTPLQLWDLDMGDGRRFWQLASARRVNVLRQSGLNDKIISEMIVRAAVDATTRLPATFDSIYLTGGLTMLQGFVEALRRTRSAAPVFCGTSGSAYAVAGKKAMFGGERMIVVDMGQTAVKVYMPDGSPFRFKRDRYLIPTGECPNKGDRTVHWLREIITHVCSLDPSASVLLSLPCPVTRDLVPGTCTYGIAGRKTFIDEIFGRLECPVFVINDAELAAECARQDVKRMGPVLTLTLGYGPGGALLER